MWSRPWTPRVKTESAPSSAGICTNNLFANGGANTIAWSASSGASRYNVYKEQGGLYGYIGQTAGTSLVDDNIAPDLSVTPPIYEAVFNAAGDYPAAVSYFEQRRCCRNDQQAAKHLDDAQWHRVGHVLLAACA